MNYLKASVLIITIVLFGSCNFQNSKIQESQITIERHHLIGKWISIDKTDVSEKSEFIINSLQYNNDSTVYINITDSEGTKIKTGSWKLGDDHQVIGIIPIKASFSVFFSLDDNHAYTCLPKLVEENGKILMYVRNSTFEKE